MGISGGFFAGRTAMKYEAFTNDSLTVMYEVACGALASDDAQERQNAEPRFCE